MGQLVSLRSISPRSTASPTLTTSPDWAGLCSLPPLLRERLVVQLNRFVHFARENPDDASQVLEENDELMTAWKIGA